MARLALFFRCAVPMLRALGCGHCFACSLSAVVTVVAGGKAEDTDAALFIPSQTVDGHSHCRCPSSSAGWRCLHTGVGLITPPPPPGDWDIPRSSVLARHTAREGRGG